MFLRKATPLAWIVLVSLAPAVEAQVALKPKFEPGTSFKARETTKVVQSLKLNGQDLPTKADNTVVNQVTYGKRDEKGNLPISSKIESIVADLSLPGGLKLHFDSAKPDEKAENPALEAVLDIFRKLTGLTLTHTINSDLKVVSVEGVEEGTQLNPDELREEFQQSIDFFPSDPVKSGDAWERTVVQGLGQGQVLTYQRKYEYQGQAPQFPTVKDSKLLDKITATDMSVEYSVKPGRGLPINVTKSDLKVDSSKYTYWIDRKAGRVVAAEGEAKIKGALSLRLMGMDFEGDLDLTLNSREEEID